MPRRLLIPALLALFVLPPTLAQAQGTPPSGRIEVSRGPAVGSARAISLAGAYSSIAEGLSGLEYNPAAVANRYASADRWWDVDVTFSYAFLPFGDTDYENDGENSSAVSSQRNSTVGLMAQGGYVGLAWQRQCRLYDFRAEGGLEVEFEFVEHKLAVSGLIEPFDLAVGATLLFESTNLRLQKKGALGQLDDETVAAATLGGGGGADLSGAELGILYRPEDQPWRIGGALRLTGAQRRTRSRNVERFDELGIAIPQEVRSPVELRIGGSYQVGRNYNPQRRWRFPNEIAVDDPAGDTPKARTRFRDQPRDLRPYGLFAFDLGISPSQVEGGRWVGAEGFTLGRDERAGADWTLTARLGLEAEIIPSWFRMRAGSYFEPSRFSGVNGRMHFTGGFEAHFPHMWLFELMGVAEAVAGYLDSPLSAEFYLDTAENYLSLGFGIGVWH